VEPVDSVEWSEDALKWFKDYVLEKDFFAMELTKGSTHSHMTLLDTSTNRDVDVRDALKEAGFAQLYRQPLGTHGRLQASPTVYL